MKIKLIIILFLLFIFYRNNKIENFRNYEKNINYPIYWINLKRSLNRKKRIKIQFNKYKLLNNTRINAVDGMVLKLDNIIINKTALNKTSKNELACTLSHFKAIITSLKNNDEISIICEDDLCFDLIPHWKYNLDYLISELPNNWEIVNLAPTNYMFLGELVNYKKHFIKWNRSHWGAMCYLINKKGMLKLNKIYHLMDNKIEFKLLDKIVADDLIYKNLNSYTITRPLFTYLNNGSIIHSAHETNHSLGKKMILKFYNVNIC